MTKKTFAELKKEFEKGGPNTYQSITATGNPRCYIFDQIGQLAADNENETDALKFVAECLKDSDKFVRSSAIGYCGYISLKKFALAEIDIEARLKDLIQKECNNIILKKAQSLLKNIERAKKMLSIIGESADEWDH